MIVFEYIFDFIYGLFRFMYGDGLKEHLWGLAFDPNTGNFDYIGTNLYNVCGVIALISAILIAVFFYYIWNPARSMRPRWFIMLAVTAVINLIVGFAIPYMDLVNERFSLPEGYYVSGLDCFMFGFSNLIVSATLFFIVSVSIKWWSSGNRHIPF